MKEVLANLFIMNQYISLDYGWRGRGKGKLIQLRHFKNWEGIFDDGEGSFLHNLYVTQP